MSSERFLRWVQRQPSVQHYTYVSNTNCPYARYLRQSRWTLALVGGFGWSGLFLGFIPCWGRIDHEVNEALVGGKRTYGALAQRLMTAA